MLNTSCSGSLRSMLRHILLRLIPISVTRKVVADLLDKNLDAELLVPEDDDISLSERVRRINAHCLALGKKNSWSVFM